MLVKYTALALAAAPLALALPASRQEDLDMLLSLIAGEDPSVTELPSEIAAGPRETETGFTTTQAHIESTVAAEPTEAAESTEAAEPTEVAESTEAAKETAAEGTAVATGTQTAVEPVETEAEVEIPQNVTALPNTTGVEDIKDQTFDYVIVGGGLGGSVLARRLADANATVLVVEAGRIESNNVNVTDSTKYQAAFDTDIDWAFQTVNQTAANNGPQTMRSGKGFGGSTIINGMAWTKPHDFQLDALEELGNEGVNWNTLQTYMMGVESFTAPNQTQLAAGITWSPECRGDTGFIHVAVNQEHVPGELEHTYNQTGLDRGLPYVDDLTCGNPAGFGTVSHNAVDGVRYDAYTGYLLDKDLQTLTILTEAHVGKVLFSEEETPRATGIEFKAKDGKIYTVNAKREVIMAAGSIMTPVVLQHSGIGPAAVLECLGVKQVVDLPVGQNLIDQTTVTSNWNTKVKGGQGLPIMWPRFQDIVTGDDRAKLTGLLENNLDAFVEDAVANGAYSADASAGLKKILEIQRDWILNKNSSVSESFDYTYDNVLGFDSWFLLPFGRGSIIIEDADPYSTDFTIDPRFFANEFDTLATAATVRYTRRYSEVDAMRSVLKNENWPGTNATDGGVKPGGTLDDWTEWIKQNYRSNWHPIGTASMMSRELGGVVDSSHRVYGVNGLRIVDGSNLPFQVSSHLMSVLYGFAERAAELITAEHGSGDVVIEDNDDEDTEPSPPTSSACPSANTVAVSETV